MYKMFFPSGNAEEFCDHVFRTFDMDKNGYIDFKVRPDSWKLTFIPAVIHSFPSTLVKGEISSFVDDGNHTHVVRLWMEVRHLCCRSYYSTWLNFFVALRNCERSLPLSGKCSSFDPTSAIFPLPRKESRQFVFMRGIRRCFAFTRRGTCVIFMNSRASMYEAILAKYENQFRRAYNSREILESRERETGILNSNNREAVWKNPIDRRGNLSKSGFIDGRGNWKTQGEVDFKVSEKLFFFSGREIF